ncbi:MAG: transglycosylase SLT domain-containing protein [Rhodospirillaceae bacterium]|nr:transglycosylase SLT domain-containing protein [Rhodospirillales bacterium]
MAKARVIWLTALMVLIGARGAVANVPGLPTQVLCAKEVSQAERSYGIPSQLLDAISLVESGRYDSESRATLAWPWTVMAEGEGRYFPSKAEAVAEVKKLKARGIKNIDVGCMQVNLMYHGAAFSSLEDAFEPASNVGYAARFLKGLFATTNHWPTAASYYHSQTPGLAATYRAKLMKVWHGGGSSKGIASLSPVRPPSQPPQGPRPSSSPQIEQVRKDWQARRAASETESSRIAAAYRQARLVEYQMRRATMVEARRAR